MESNKLNVLITGVSGNLGQATVKRFLEDGHTVIAISSPRKKNTFSSAVEVHEADLTDEQTMEDLIGEILARHKRIHAALLLAGGFRGGNIAATRTSDLDAMISLNFKTAYNVVRPVYEHMKGQKDGKIILVGARAAMKANDGKNLVAYSLSKSMLRDLAGLLNADGAAHNVITSLIVPGTIDTPQNREGMPSSDFDKWVRPEEIADVIHYLCSSRARVLRDPVIRVYGNS